MIHRHRAVVCPTPHRCTDHLDSRVVVEAASLPTQQRGSSGLLIDPSSTLSVLPFHFEQHRLPDRLVKEDYGQWGFPCLGPELRGGRRTVVPQVPGVGHEYMFASWESPVVFLPD